MDTLANAQTAITAVDAAISVWGADRVGLHIAPRADAHDMGDSDLEATFTYVAQEMAKRGIAFIFAREGRGEPYLGPKLKDAFGGMFIANQQLSLQDGEEILAAGEADAISWGQQFIANPDLVERYAQGAALNDPDPSTYYGEGPKGYTDYLRLD